MALDSARALAEGAALELKVSDRPGLPTGRWIGAVRWAGPTDARGIRRVGVRLEASLARGESGSKSARAPNGDLRRQLLRWMRGQRLQTLGEVTAGVAADLTRPAGHILSKLTALARYFRRLARLPLLTGKAVRPLSEGRDPRKVHEEIEQLWREGEAALLVEDFRKPLEGLRAGAERILEISMLLRDSSRPDDDVPREFDLNRDLSCCLRVCESRVPEGVRFRRELGDVPPLIGRPRRIQQVFLNLPLNAVEAVDSGAETVVSTHAGWDRAVVRIRDAGRGVPAGGRAHLFEPFFSTKPPGSGLGLFCAAQIVREHEGEILAEIEPGRTVFAVRLPLPSLNKNHR